MIISKITESERKSLSSISGHSVDTANKFYVKRKRERDCERAVQV